MSKKFLHRITATDPASRQQVTTLLAELQGIFIRANTPMGPAISSVIRSWRLEKDGSYIVEFSSLMADRLPDLSGLPLLQAAKGLATTSPPAPVEAAH